MLFQKGDRIVFAGDSVTDMGSAAPVSEGLFDNLGHGYVRMVDNLLAAWYPDVPVRVTNAGVSGNTSRDLLARFDRDVLALTPDWVSICIGINDVWRQFDSPSFGDSCCSPEEYEQNLGEMIARAQGTAQGVFVLTPYYMEPNPSDLMRARMEEYVEIARKLADEYDCFLVDFQRMYDRYFESCHSAFIAWDRVHPNEKGATLMAREFLRAVEFDFERE